MKKVTILALHLNYGGIEKFIANISNMLVEKYEVEIISTYYIKSTPAFVIHPDVKITYLLEDLKPNREELKSAFKSIHVVQMVKQTITALKVLYYRKKRMIQAIKNIQNGVVISTRDFHNKWLSKYAKNGILKIATEHNDLLENKKYTQKVIKSCRAIDYLISPTLEMAQYYATEVKTAKSIYIPHFLENIPDEVSNLEDKIILAVGRLSPEKGFLDLMEVFRQVNQKHKDSKLYLIGDGVEKPKLEELIGKYQLSDHVILTGFREKEYIDQISQRASIYAMTSFRESFGFVVLEAFSFGIPCVSFDSAKGALNIIEDGKNGYIVKERNIGDMAEKINMLLESTILRKEFGKNARQKSIQYAKDSIKEQWYQLIS